MNAQLHRLSTLLIGTMLLLATACHTQAPRRSIDRSGLPAVGAPTQWTPPTVETWRMDNGMTVYYVPMHHAPLLNVQLILPHGASTDPQGKAGLTDLMADMLDEGTAAMTAMALSDALQRLATDYHASASTDTITLSMHLIASKLGPSLALFRDVVRTPTLPKTEFDRRKAQRIAGALSSEAEPGTGQWNTIRRVLAGTGYAGTPTGGTRTTLLAIQHEDVVAHYKNVVAPQGASIVVVGDADRPTVKKAITKAFGDWSGSPTVQQRSPAPPTQDIHAIHLIDYPGSAQSAIAVARPAGPFDSPTRVEDKIFNRVLGGAFVSRINMNLREDKGYTYGARSIFARLRRLGMFVTYSNVKSSTTLASLQEIQKEMVGIVGGKPITPDELNAAKKGLLLGLPAKYERIGTVADQVATLATYGLPPDWLQMQAKKIDAVSMESVTESAKCNAVWGRMAIVVAGDRALIEDDLKKLGLPILLYDPQGNRLQSGVQSARAVDR